MELPESGAGVPAHGVGAESPTANAVQSSADVYSLLSALMVERAELRDEIEKLKSATPQEDEFGKFAKQSVPFIDAMERILQLGKAQASSDEAKVWIQGVESAYKRILRSLERHQLSVVSYMGQDVDLGAQEVIEYRATKDYPHNTIIEEPFKGVVFRGRLMREAKVVVACNQ